MPQLALCFVVISITPELREEDEVDSERAKALIEEFKEAGHLHRLHVTLMFGQITGP